MTGQSLVAINSGANMNFDRLRYVAERTLVGEKQEALFAVTIPEERGSFRRWYGVPLLLIYVAYTVVGYAISVD